MSGRTWTVRVREGCRLPVVQSAGREFARGEAYEIREGERGWCQIIECTHLEAIEQPKVQPKVQRRKRAAVQKEGGEGVADG